MGLALILIGIVLWAVLGWTLLGVLLIFVGLILLFVPNTYGYSDWRGRRGPL